MPKVVTTVNLDFDEKEEFVSKVRQGGTVQFLERGNP